MKDIYILGVGHNTPVYIELAESCGYRILGLFHFDNSRTGDYDHGIEIVGSFEDLFSQSTLRNMNFALSQGDNAVRAELFRRIVSKGGNIPTLVHPTANVSRFATLGKGTVIHINSVIHPDVAIGDNTVISYNSSVTHNTVIGNNSYVALGAMIGAYVNIGNNVFIGIGVNVISGKVDYIGDNSYIGAGSLLTKSIEKNSLVAGSPARVIRHLDEEK